MRVHHLNCATMCPVSARLVNGRGGLLARARMVCHCLLIESTDGLVLVDTGLGDGDVAQPAQRLGRTFLMAARPVCDPAETARAQVERLGFRRQDVRHIVLTHGDLDHAGGLPDFPEAEVHIYEREHQAVTARATREERMRYRPLHFAHAPRWVIHPLAGERWEGFEAVRALPGEEVLLVPLIGHTRGHAAVAVRAGERWLLHAGDAYFFGGQLDPERPWCPGGLGLFQRLVDFDRTERVKNQERLRALRRARGQQIDVFCAHDPLELEALAPSSAAPVSPG